MPDLRLSIIIPAYNGERFLSSAIASAMAQTRKADEIIVVDDASTDLTPAIAQSSEWRKSVSYFYHEKEDGFVAAWNHAIQKATGDFVSILHQDDMLRPGYLAGMEEALKRFPQVRHLYAACNYVDEHGNITGLPPEPHSIDPVLYTGRQYAHNYLHGALANRHIHRCPGVMTSKELLVKQCTYRKEAGHIADDDFFLRVGAFTDVVGISWPLASFRHHKGSETGRLDNLSLHLARDYVFQGECYRSELSLLDRDDIEKINGQAVRFINLLLLQSLLTRNAEWKSESLNLRERLDSLLPGFFMKTLPAWARVMWKMVASKRVDSLARHYARTLDWAIKTRNIIRKRH